MRVVAKVEAKLMAIVVVKLDANVVVRGVATLMAH